MSTIDDVAAARAAGYEEGATPGVAALLSVMNDPCAVYHLPPAPGDGPLSKGFLTRGLHLEWKLFQSAVERFALAPEVKVEDESGIRVTLGVTGAVNGEPIAFTGSMRLDIEDGKVIQITGGFDDYDEVGRVMQSPAIGSLAAEMAELAAQMAGGNA